MLPATIFLIGAFFVADELEKERNVVGAALVADALDPGMFDVVDALRIVRRVVEQDLDAVGSRFFQPADRPLVEQVRKTSRPGLVVPRLLVRHQKPGVLRPALARGQAPFRIQQDRARVRREHLGHEGLELLDFTVSNFSAFFLRQRFLQRAPLIHRGSGNHPALIRHGLHAGELPWCHLQDFVLLGNDHFITGNPNSSTTVPASACSIISCTGSEASARSTSPRRAFVAGCFGVNNVQQS